MLQKFLDQKEKHPHNVGKTNFLTGKAYKAEKHPHNVGKTYWKGL